MQNKVAEERLHPSAESVMRSVWYGFDSAMKDWLNLILDDLVNLM